MGKRTIVKRNGHSDKALNTVTISPRVGRVEDLENSEERFDVVFSSWGHIKWNEQGHIMERIASNNAIVMLVNNWGEDDDLSKVWPDISNQKFITRRKLMKEGNFFISRLDSYLDLTNESTFESVSAIFSKEHMLKHRSGLLFNIGIAFGWKSVSKEAIM